MFTIAENSEGLFKDKGSKFIAFAYRIDSVDEVKPIVDELKKKYYDARHHCYAYYFDEEKYFRANDDGEPSGTAGKPILGQIYSNNLTNILIVVIRYFGGILLGTSGLINAYKNATIDVINNSKLIEYIPIVEKTIVFDYKVMDKMMKAVKIVDSKIIEMSTEGVKSKLIIRIDKRKIPQLDVMIEDINSPF